jgi:hypothetical protein
MLSDEPLCGGCFAAGSMIDKQNKLFLCRKLLYVPSHGHLVSASRKPVFFVKVCDD